MRLLAKQGSASQRIEPNMGVPGSVLFSHGRTMNEPFGAVTLHYGSRGAYGPMSNDRVHKTFFYGSKHIDQYVPKTNPNPPMTLTDSKKAEWALQNPPPAPTVRGTFILALACLVQPCSIFC